ncbi:MAG: M24 family metallopeptidase [Bdellovibrionota bacterium]
MGKKFTPAQARIYDLVLRAQKEAIALCKPGSTIPSIHQRVCEILTDGMLSLGLLRGRAEDLVEQGTYKRFYPHQTSHWLGLDVHDVGLYQVGGDPRPLAPGMVLTIEPGFYVQPTDGDVPPEYRDIGIRIEDDILITANGCENLTASAPKEREELESLKK